MGKFQTTNSVLFNNNNKNSIPDWMININENININKKTINLDFEKKGAFASTSNVTRRECIASPRSLELNFNSDKAILDSKVELAKFLRGKYYRVSTEINDNIVSLSTTIDGIQAKFIFKYKIENGKPVQDDTFLINDREYPFSTAGFEESLEDLKNGLLEKSSIKIASTKETYVINREEIVRRFNGHIRQATDEINKMLKEGIIVGVGSNSYATYYDPNELFPQQEKEIPNLPQGSFEFVNNTEHVKTNEFKSAKKLSFSAGKLITSFFSDYIINDFKRNDNLLIVNATVLNANTGIRHNLKFNFDIVNENIKSIKNVVLDNNTFTMEELMTKLNNRNNLVNDYLKTSVASKRIVSGGILTKSEIKKQLMDIVDCDTIDDFIESWIDLNLIKQIGKESYSTEKSFTELLDSVISETLSDDEKNKINLLKKKFGEGLELERIEQKDTGVRESDEIDLSYENKLSIINNELSKKFKQYHIASFNNDIVDVIFRNNGVKHSMKLKPIFNNRKLLKIVAIVKNKELELDNICKSFTVNDLLKNYINNNSTNNFSTTIIASEKNILNRLAQLVVNPEDIFNQWKNKYLYSLGGSIYSSEYTFEELLNKTNALLLSEEDKQQLLIAQQHFGNSFERIDEDDTGIRDLEINSTNETMLYEANNYLSQHFDNYKPKNFKSNDNNAVYAVELFDNQTGLTSIIEFIFNFENNKVLNCSAKINNEIISLNNIKTAFAMNESLSRYLQNNNKKKFNAPMIITKKDLFRRLSSISNLSYDDIEKIVSGWNSQGKINILSNDIIASKNSLERLISESNIKALNDEEIMDKINKSQRDKLFRITSNHIKNNDTRRPEYTLSPEQILTNIKVKLGSIFNDFDILDVNCNDENYSVTARIINPFNGLKQVLLFDFNTNNGSHIGEIKSINNGKITVSKNEIDKLLKTDNVAINKFIKVNNNSISKKKYKSILTASSLKSKLLSLTGINKYNLIVNNLVDNNIIVPIGSEKFVCEYSLSDLIEYLYNENLLDLEKANNDLNEYAKDTILFTDGPVVMDCDNRKIEKQEPKLSPKLIETVMKLNDIITKAKSNKKITANKFNYFKNNLDNCKNSLDIEKVWKEIKRYL